MKNITPTQPQTKRPGRPSSYRPEWCEQVLELGRTGKSRCQIAAALGVDAKTLRRQEQQHPEFAEALQWARELSQAWWEDLGQEGCTDRNFNANAYSLQIRNRFPTEWRDKTDIAVGGPDNGPVQLQLKRSLSDEELLRIAAPHLFELENGAHEALPALPPADDFRGSIS